MKQDLSNCPMCESPFRDGSTAGGIEAKKDATQLSQSSDDIQQKTADVIDGDLTTSDSQQLSTSLPNLNSPQAASVLETTELDKGTKKHGWLLSEATNR